MSSTTHYIGVIEWSSDAGESPAVFASTDPRKVRAAAVAHIFDMGPSIDDHPGFMEDYPMPDLADDAAVRLWLAELREAATAPWFTVYETTGERVQTWASSTETPHDPEAERA